jgi:hypothetical protein
MSYKEIIDIETRIDEVRAELVESTRELRTDIKSQEEKLDQMKKKLKKESELSYQIIDTLQMRKKGLKNKMEALDSIEKYKRQVHELYLNNDFEKINEMSITYTNLQKVFVGNRFCNYIYNDKFPREKTHYTNNGGPGDSSWTEQNYIPREGDIIFDTYKAYEITGSKLTSEEKLKSLDGLFDNFLNGKN